MLTQVTRAQRTCGTRHDAEIEKLPGWPMDATLLIAIWGAVTGTIGAGAVVWTLARDRPRVEVTQRPDYWNSRSLPDDPMPYLGLLMVVANEGRRAVTIHHAGFAANTQVIGRWPRRQRGPTVFTIHDEVPARLEPGEPLVLRHELDPGEFDPENVPQAFAELRNDRVIWARPFDPWNLRLLRDRFFERMEELDAERERLERLNPPH